MPTLHSQGAPPGRLHSALPRCLKCRGTIFSEARNRGLLFAELVHAADQAIPKHTHGSAFYHLTLRGAFDESTARGMVCFAPFTSAFTHSDTSHCARVARSGTHIFTLEVGASWIQEFLQLQREPDSAGIEKSFWAS